MPITTNVTNEQITVSVGETQIDVNVSGGVGPTGNSGTVAVSAPITNAGTSTAAVIGLSVGTGLAVSGGSLAVTYGTTAGTTCQGNDARLSDARTPLSHTHTSSQITDFASAVVAAAPPTTNASLLTSGTLDAGRLPGSVVLTSDARLTDAREWSASTASQADAEAGTSTSRFAFTPQRVFQAIAAWWAGSAAKTKLDGIATGATANATDAQLRDRSTHTGTQAISTVTGLQSALDAKATPADVSSAVAAVVNAAPATLDTLNELAAALGNDASFATTVTNSLAAKAPIASPTFTGTVSGITKAMVGLGNVDNTSDANKPISTATQTALDGKAASAHTHTASAITDFTAAVVAAAPPTTDASLLTTGTLSASRLPSTTVSAGSYGSASSVATFTVDAAGRLTAAGSSSIAIAAGAVSGLAAIATSGSASDLSAGTVPFARLPVGTSSTTVAAGNDARLSDSRTPLAHAHAAADITSGVIATARLGSGATATNFLRGDSTFADPTASLTYATTAQAQDGLSTTVAMNPARTLDHVYNVYAIGINGANVNTTGQAVWQTAFAGYVNVQVGAAGGGGGLLAYHTPGISLSADKYNGTSGNFNGRRINWLRRQRFRIRLFVSFGNSVTTNAVFRILLGKTGIGTANIGALAQRGIGLEIRGGNAVWLTSHNGTARTDTNANTTLVAGASYEFICESDGSGNATLFMDGTSIATNTGAPTTAATDFTQHFFVVEATTTDSSTSLISIENAPQVSRP